MKLNHLHESDFERRKRQRNLEHEQGDLGAQVRADTEAARFGETFSIFRSPGGTFRLIPSRQPAEIGSIEIVREIPVTDQELAAQFVETLHNVRPSAWAFSGLAPGSEDNCPLCDRPTSTRLTEISQDPCVLSQVLSLAYLIHYVTRQHGWDPSKWEDQTWGPALVTMWERLGPIDWSAIRPQVLEMFPSI